MPDFLSQDEAVGLLHDRIGTHVEVVLEVTLGDIKTQPFAAAGELIHWTAEAHPTWLAAGPVNQRGSYIVGGVAVLDVLELPGLRLLAEEGEPPHGLAGHISGDAVLSIIWGTES